MIALLLFASCAVDPPALNAQNPVNPSAAAGRLAGAPATLRPGVATYADVPALRSGPEPMQHHHHGS
ncbi:MAG TPA: hypothetical protein VF403_00350 [Kofleriaceae bacterium]